MGFLTGKEKMKALGFQRAPPSGKMKSALESGKLVRKPPKDGWGGWRDCILRCREAVLAALDGWLVRCGVESQVRLPSSLWIVVGGDTIFLKKKKKTSKHAITFLASN